MPFMMTATRNIHQDAITALKHMKASKPGSWICVGFREWRKISEERWCEKDRVDGLWYISTDSITQAQLIDILLDIWAEKETRSYKGEI